MRSARQSLSSLAVVVAVTAIAPLLGARSSKPGRWYRSLRKPPQTPPAWVFGPAWTGLYALSAWSVWRIWRSPASRPRRAALTLWGLQHGMNAAWSPIFFGAHRPRAALVDLVAMFTAATAYAVAAAKVDRTAAGLIAPYVGWLAYAGSINAGVVVLNPE